MTAKEVRAGDAERLGNAYGVRPVNYGAKGLQRDISAQVDALADQIKVRWNQLAAENVQSLRRKVENPRVPLTQPGDELFRMMATTAGGTATRLEGLGRFIGDQAALISFAKLRRDSGYIKVTLTYQEASAEVIMPTAANQAKVVFMAEKYLPSYNKREVSTASMGRHAMNAMLKGTGPEAVGDVLRSNFGKGFRSEDNTGVVLYEIETKAIDKIGIKHTDISYLFEMAPKMLGVSAASSEMGLDIFDHLCRIEPFKSRGKGTLAAASLITAIRFQNDENAKGMKNIPSTRKIARMSSYFRAQPRLAKRLAMEAQRYLEEMGSSYSASSASPSSSI